MAQDQESSNDESAAFLTPDITTELADLEVDSVMIPLADIVSVDLDAEDTEILTKVANHPYTRYPAYHSNRDEIIGYLSVKQLFKSYIKNKKVVGIDKLLDQPLFIVQSRLVLDLLEEMRRDKQYMALVVDEFGGVDGLVTQKDLMDAVLNCFQKEPNNGDYTFNVNNDGSLSIDARVPVAQLEEHLGYDLMGEEYNRDDVDTVGGLIFLTIGRIPKRGEIISFNDQLEFSITEADARRIKKMRVNTP